MDLLAEKKSEKMSKILDFTQKRLQKQPIEYTVIIRHDHESMSFMVYDIQDSSKDRLAVARDLESAAHSLFKNSD